MTTGSGLYIAPTETDKQKQNRAIAQLMEGRSNAVGIVTLSSTGATATTVTAVACGPTSAVFLFPATAHASSVMSGHLGGTVTLNSTGATATTVTAVGITPNSEVFLFPATAHAASLDSYCYVQATDITTGQFSITHSTQSSTDATFWWTSFGATSFGASCYVKAADITSGQFIVTHASQSSTDATFWWACFG